MLDYLFRFMDWVLRLPEEVEEEFWREVRRFEEVNKMPYITSVERIGIKKGREQGLQQGMQQGLQQGVREGLLAGIEVGLELKFGKERLTLLPEIYKIEDVLRMVQTALRTAHTPAELRRIYRPAGDDGGPGQG